MAESASLSAQLAEVQALLRTTGSIGSQRWPELADALQDLVRSGTPSHPPWAAGLLSRNKAIPAHQAAGRLLVHLGVWDGHDDLDLLASDLLAVWPQAAVDTVAEGPELPSTVGRLEVPLVSIDSVDPHEVDDAMWAERRGDDIVLWVAIASPNCWLPPGGAVERLAVERAATLYHPRYMAPMLPHRLGAQQASLAVGCERPAIVYELAIDSDGMRRTLSIREALIQVHAAWTYDEVQAALAPEGPPADSPVDVKLASLLVEAALRSEARRIRAGAWLLYRPDVEVLAPRHGAVLLRPACQSDMARRVVGEAMVLCSTATADFFTERGLPAPFRVQPAPKEPPLPAGLYTEPVDIYAMLKHMSAAHGGTRAGRHAVLAVDGYVQATSPLRRASDLLAQRQMIAALRDEPQPLSGSAIRRALQAGRERIRRQRAVERKARRYFALVALAARGLGTVVRGQLVDDPQRRGRPLAFVPELAIDMELPERAGEPGLWCDFVVEQVAPAEDRLVVRPNRA